MAFIYVSYANNIRRDRMEENLPKCLDVGLTFWGQLNAKNNTDRSFFTQIFHKEMICDIIKRELRGR